MNSQIKSICFASRCQERKQHREGTAGGTAGDSTQGCCFLVQKKVPGPTCSSGSFPGPWHSSHPPCAPRLGAAAQPHRSEMRVANAASLARMLQDRAEPRRLFRRAFMAMILQMLRTGGAHKGGQELVPVGSAGALRNSETENAPPCSCICLCSQILSTLRAFCSVLSGMRSMCSSRYTRPNSGQWSK